MSSEMCRLSSSTPPAPTVPGRMRPSVAETNSVQNSAISATNSGSSIINMHRFSMPTHSRNCQNGPLTVIVNG